MKKLPCVFLCILLLVSTMSLGIAEVLEATPEGVVVAEKFLLDVTDLVIAVGLFLIGLIYKAVSPLLKDQRVQALVKTAYYAAEQLYAIGVVDDKLTYAETWLYDHGVKVDARELLEAFVGEINQYKQDLDEEAYVEAMKEVGVYQQSVLEDFMDEDDEDLNLPDYPGDTED